MLLHKFKQSSFHLSFSQRPLNHIQVRHQKLEREPFKRRALSQTI